MAVKSDRPRDQLDPGPRKIVRGADAVTESAAADLHDYVFARVAGV